MADFEALPVDNGVGPYHFNRYRVTFLKPPGRSKENLALNFISQFCQYFNSEYATVEKDEEHKIEGDLLLKFHANALLAKFHHDWVVSVDMNLNSGFTVQTLERKFRLREDAEMLGEGVVGGGATGAATGAGVGAVATFFGGGIGAGPLALVGGAVGALAGGSLAYYENFKHFLAGRRAWRLDNAAVFGASGDYLVLETAAVERASCEFYRANDKVQGLEKSIPAMWNSQLSSFVAANRLAIAPRAPPVGWLKGGRQLETDYLVTSSESLSELKANREFQQASKAFPNLLPSNLR